MFLLGSHTGVITPPLPVALGGYNARTAPANEIHDELYVRSLVFRDGETFFVLVTADVLHFSREMTAQVRQATAEETGIPQACIMLAASHTHSGPATSRTLFGEPTPAYLRWLVNALTSSICQAFTNLEEVGLDVLTGEVSGLGTNRIDPTLPYDGTARILTAWGVSELKAVLLNYGCHPTVLGPDNLLISADWPGATMALLQQAWGELVWIGFVQGASGDVSSRFVRQGQGFAAVEQLGRLLADKALELQPHAQPKPIPPGSLAIRSRTVSLRRHELPSAAEGRQRVAEARAHLQAVTATGASHGEVRVAQSALEGAQVEALWSGMRDELEYECEVQVVKLGSQIALVAVAGELFSSLGQLIRSRSPFSHTMVIGYANGLAGYLPDRGAFARGGYEASSAYTAPGSGEQLVEIALELLIELNIES